MGSFWTTLQLTEWTRSGIINQWDGRCSWKFRLQNIMACLTWWMKTDGARVILFQKGVSAEALPPTSNALHYHWGHITKRRCGDKQVLKLCLLDLIGHGWKLQNEVLVPKLMSLTPIPNACLEVIFCACKMGCRSLRCKCRKAKLPCTWACSCNTQDVECVNKPDN